jgi:hypothetical protein
MWQCPLQRQKQKKIPSFLGGFSEKENLQHKNISFSEHYVALG